MLSGMSTTQLFVRVIGLLLVIISASLHEFGHAYAAHLLGDDTAKEMGRLTPNPLAHIDPFGSVILPMLLIMSGGGFIAYAKPVPFNPNRLRNPRRDEALVALAGPACNLLQAVVGAVAFRILLALVYGNEYAAYYVDTSAISWLLVTFETFVYVNCSLAFFNLIPLPPLDGSKILSLVVTGDARRIYNKVQRNALPILLVAIYLLPMIASRMGLPWLDFISMWLHFTAGNVANILLGW